MEARHAFTHYRRQASLRVGAFTHCPFCATALEPVTAGSETRPGCPACGFIHYRNPAPAVSILILDGDRVLLGRRQNEPGKGAWALPSGYVEWEDDFLGAAVREAREETGLDVVPQAIVNVASSFVSPRYHFLGVYLTATVAAGAAFAAQPGDDLDAVAWYSVHGPLPALGFPEDAHAIALVANGGPCLPLHAGATQDG